jgi:uncharacterized caspase-like protein/ankyrin repeat protein
MGSFDKKILYCVTFFCMFSSVNLPGQSIDTSNFNSMDPECDKKGGILTWMSYSNSWECMMPNGNINKYAIPSSVEVNKITQSGYSVLTDAATSGDIKLMKELILQGADINYQHQDGTYPLYKFIISGYSKNTPEESLKMVKWMIENGADYTKAGYNKYSLIHASQNIELTKYLVELGLDVKTLTTNGATTLMGSLASYLEGRTEDVSVQKYLIEHCVDVNGVAKFGSQSYTALDIAKRFERIKAMTLIEASIQNPPLQCKNNGIIPPTISFYNISETYDTDNANIGIQIEAQGSGIGNIIFKLNESEIEVLEDKNVSTKRDGAKVKTYNVKLQKGLNEITAYAFDITNTVKSEEIHKNIVADYKQKDPQLYALAIGIDEFQLQELNLKYAEADATLFGTTLFKRTKNLFSKVNIEYMKKNGSTTKKAILEKLESYKSISPNDFFVFYSATHGVSIDDKYYMITSNITSTDIETIRSETISEDDLRKAFKKIPTANKLLLFDTCYSGGINDKVSKKLAESTVNQLNLTSITAANSRQTALEGFADGHGIFTYVLSDALDGDADINGDGLVQSMELVHYTNKMVPIEAKKYNHMQTPAYFQSGQIFIISKLRDFSEKVNLQPQYYKADEVKQLFEFMDSNNIIELNKLMEKNKNETTQTVEKIIKEAPLVEAKKAFETFQSADKKYQFGKNSFIFNDNSIFINIKDPIKEHFHFVDGKGRNLIVFDFNSNEPAPRVVTGLNTEKVSDIYMADRGDWYRVVLQTKSKQAYDYVVKPEGIFIKLKNAN